jgi:hypothetical protein
VIIAMWRQQSFGLAFLAVGLAAHHSTAPYDLIHGTVIGGNVTKFAWMNPHSLIYVDVIAEEGAVEHWVVEIESPRMLEPLGWKKDLVKVGERVTIMGSRAKNGKFAMRGVTVELTDGRKLRALAEN